MIIQNQSSIESFFDFKSKNKDGSITMYKWNEVAKYRLYIVNRNHRKLLQFIVKNEPYTNGQEAFAQIKIIPYVAEYAKVYNDQPGDPSLFRVYKKIEMTYHGGPKEDKKPKIHLKVTTQTKKSYRTLVDCSLSLDNSIPRLAPVCSFFSGYVFDWPKTKKISKKSHMFEADSDYPIRFDFYLSGKNFDPHAYINSIYSMNMFFSLDYLIAKENSPLQGHPIVQPITGFLMKDYYLWVRCSRSPHKGKPFIQLYNNKDYYEKIMNRHIAYIDKEGQISRSNMLNKEMEITDYLYSQKENNKS